MINYSRENESFFFFFLVEIDNIFLKRISLSNHLNEVKDVREKGMTEESLLFEKKKEKSIHRCNPIFREISRETSRENSI